MAPEKNPKMLLSKEQKFVLWGVGLFVFTFAGGVEGLLDMADASSDEVRLLSAASLTTGAILALIGLLQIFQRNKPS